ncbi:MAG: extracellular solute-binding protein [Bacillota bacterium]|nr:extracellular solute-binding protein [Bacillota bacterium]
MRKSFTRVLNTFISITVITAISAGLQGCKNEVKEVSKTAVDSQEKTLKIDVLSMLANYAGEQSGWFGKVVKDKFNIELNIIAPNLQGGDSKYASMMAAGNLGDIVIFGNDDQKYIDAIKSGLLLDWTKDGLLDKYGQDILRNYPKAVEKNETNFGSGKSVFGLGHEIANMPPASPSEGNTMIYGSDLRWDIYEKVGSPRMKSMEDLLPVLKKMQEVNPKSDSGRPTYGFSMWADWDNNMMMAAKQFACMQGYDELGFLLVHANQEKYQDILDPKGYYLRTLKLYYDANKMGLVDPDSIAQKFDDYGNKLMDGQILFDWFPWLDGAYNTPERVAEGKGMAFVPFSDESVYSYGFTSYGGNRVIAIGSKAKEPDRVMKFIDWLYTPEGIMTANYGPKGLAWDMRDGKPVVTDFGKAALPTNDVTVTEQFGGGSFKEGVNQMNFTTVKLTSINPDFNEPYDYNLWQSSLNSNPTKLDESWRNAMGAQTQKEYLLKNNMIAVSTALSISTDTPGSSLQQKQNQISAVIKEYSWKMVFANSDSEFTSLQKEMIGKAKSLGYEDVVKFYIGQAQKQFEARKNAK